jgi:hypothetical protein
MANQGVIHNRGTYRAVASENIAVNLLVEPHTVAGQVSLCPANGCAVGVAYEAVASGAAGAFQVISKGDIVYSLSSAAIAIGDYVMPAASGQLAPESVVTTKTEFTCGVALSATSGAAAGVYWMAI